MTLYLQLLPVAPPPVLGLTVVNAAQPIQSVVIERQGPAGAQGPAGPGLPEGVTLEIVGSASQYAEFTLPDDSKRHLRLLTGPAPV